MGFTYYLAKAIKLALIILGLTNWSAVFFYCLISGFLEEKILHFQMSTPSALCLGAFLIALFVWSLTLIVDEVFDVIVTNRKMKEFDDLLSKKDWDKANEWIKSNK